MEPIENLRTGRPCGSTRTMLPVLGRATELGAAAHLMLDEGARLLTLPGTGGVGKTRLALELAEGLEPAFRDGVCVVDCSVLRDPTLVPFAIASALSVRQISSGPMLEHLAAQLRGR